MEQVKVTLLSIITRLMKRDFGEVYIEEREISDWDKKELSKKIAILKQSNNLNNETYYKRIS